ncbi:MAG: hypothetical protein ACE5Q6_08000 [Dehalococcoidia bacterium]
MIDVVSAIIAGLVGGAAMAAILYLGIGMMPNQMKMNQFRLLGTMMLPDGAMAYVGGAMIHAVMSIVFAIIHVALYAAFGLDSNLVVWGLLFGAVHWAVVGMALGMMPMMHVGIKNGTIGAPGAFAMGYPMMTTGGFLMLHLVFGLLVGLVYGALV